MGKISDLVSFCLTIVLGASKSVTVPSASNVAVTSFKETESTVRTGVTIGLDTKSRGTCLFVVH